MTRQSRTSYVINHSHGFGWAKTCITPHFSSQISSRLLFRAHTSYQSLSVLEWSTDISLTVEPRRRYDSHRLLTTPISARLKGKKKKKHLWEHRCFPCCELPSALCGQAKCPRSNHVCGAQRWGQEWRIFAALLLSVLHIGSSVLILSWALQAPH